MNAKAHVARLAAAVAIHNRLLAALSVPGWPSMPDDEFEPLVRAAKQAARRVDDLRGLAAGVSL